MTKKRERETEKKSYQKKDREKKLCYDNNESPYGIFCLLVVVTIKKKKERKKTGITTTKKISHLLMCITPSTTTITIITARKKLKNTYEEKGSGVFVHPFTRDCSR